MRISLLIMILFVSGCSTAVSAAAVYAVGKYSEQVEIKTRQYKGIDKCFMEDVESPFYIGDALVFGDQVAKKYQILLNPEGRDIDPVLPHHLAYAYYIIAEKMGDSRAVGRKKWLQPYLDEDAPDKLEDFIERKYLMSYLTKCFFVPAQYKKTVSERERAVNGEMLR